MIKRLSKYNKLSETLFLLLLSVFSVALIIIRVYFSKQFTFIFLVWNLFLAAIPWGITTFLIVFPKIKDKKVLLILFLSIWLLFFPNSTYILTDLFHLRLNFSMPIWFDLILILSFAWTGVMFAFISLIDLENILLKYFKKTTIFVLISIVLYVSSFGIYIGRFLRWNSWDVIQEPFSLFFDVANRFVNPLNHPRTWGVTILLGTFLNLAFWSFKLFTNKKMQ